MLWKYSQGLKQVAAQGNNVLFVDQFTAVINVINLACQRCAEYQVGGPAHS
jgi:hypothetical protein